MGDSDLLGGIWLCVIEPVCKNVCLKMICSRAHHACVVEVTGDMLSGEKVTFGPRNAVCEDAVLLFLHEII